MVDESENFEKEIFEALERDSLKRAKNIDKEIKIAEQAARNYLTKASRINIRLSSTDLTLLKRKAAQEGLPYQTLIASILHKFATGSLSKG